MLENGGEAANIIFLNDFLKMGLLDMNINENPVPLVRFKESVSRFLGRIDLIVNIFLSAV